MRSLGVPLFSLFVVFAKGEIVILKVLRTIRKIGKFEGSSDRAQPLFFVFILVLVLTSFCLKGIMILYLCENLLETGADVYWLP